MGLLELFIKKTIEGLSKNNNCDHTWASVFTGKGVGVLCRNCGELLCDSLSKKQADHISDIANSIDKVVALLSV